MNRVPGIHRICSAGRCVRGTWHAPRAPRPDFTFPASPLLFPLPFRAYGRSRTSRGTVRLFSDTARRTSCLATFLDEFREGHREYVATRRRSWRGERGLHKERGPSSAPLSLIATGFLPFRSGVLISRTIYAVPTISRAPNHSTFPGRTAPPRACLVGMRFHGLFNNARIAALCSQ